MANISLNSICERIRWFLDERPASSSQVEQVHGPPPERLARIHQRHLLVPNGVSFFIAAWTQNKYGRKMGLYIGYIFLVSGTILQTAAPNPAAFIAARGLLGCAAG